MPTPPLRRPVPGNSLFRWGHWRHGMNGSYLVPVAAKCNNKLLKAPPQLQGISDMAMFHLRASLPVEHENGNNACFQQVHDLVEQGPQLWAFAPAGFEIAPNAPKRLLLLHSGFCFCNPGAESGR